LADPDGGTVDVDARLPFTVDVGAPSLGIDFFVVVNAGFNSSADFSNTARIRLEGIPVGVTFKSESGVFLTGGSPVSSVPEPDTLTLMGLGIAGVMGFARRRAFRQGRASL
jgi:hypothetical protein